jgi:hypothetical protein
MTMSSRSCGLTGHAAVLVAVAMVVALCSGWSSAMAAGPDCGVQAPGPDSLASAFASLPKRFSVKAICPAEVGPGLAGQELTAEFSDEAAGEVTQTDVSIGDQHGLVVLRVLAGKLKSGSGDAFVDAFLSRLGPDARDGTVTLGGHAVQYFDIPGGDGYAYAQGPTVVIGYIRPPSEVDPKRPEWVELPAREAFTRVLAAATGAPIATDAPAESGMDGYPLTRGRYTTAGDAGWIFFKTPTGWGCGIGPNGVVGCDMVPGGAPTPDNTFPGAPSGTNQTVASSSEPGRYVHSDTPTFTRDVDTLPPGRRLENGGAACGVGYQGTVGCETGEHGFTVTGLYGSLH